MNQGINKSNYEAYFLDYLEGRLSAAEAEDLFAFLLVNPALADELEEMRQGFDVVSNISDLELSAEKLNETDKFTLRKANHESGLSQSDLLLVKEFEGDLEGTEAADLHALLLAKPELTKVQDAFRRTRLQPELHLAFDAKDELVYDERSQLQSPVMLMAAELEGKISSEERALLDALCTTNEQLKRERAAMHMAKLLPTNIPFQEKDSLLWPDVVDLTDTEMLLAAAAEGDLTSAELTMLQSRFTSASAFAAALESMKRAKLVPLAIPFAHKDSLRRREALVIPLRKYFAYTSAAAAVAVLIYTLWPQPTEVARMAAQWQNQRTDSLVAAPSEEQTDKTQLQEPTSKTISWPKQIQTKNDEVAQEVATPNATPQKDNSPTQPTAPLQATEIPVQPLANNAAPAVDSSSTPMGVDQTLLADHVVTYESDTKKFKTLGEIVESKVKSWAWGDNNYPNKGFGSALFQREMAKRSASKSNKNKREKQLVVENVKTPHEHYWQFKFGKLEFKKHFKK